MTSAVALAILDDPAVDVESLGNEDGIVWIVVRHSMGFRCGYVYLDPEHPWQKNPELQDEVDVHGGITGGLGESWVGFDTSHAHDYWEDMNPMYSSLLRPDGDPFIIRWTLDMIVAETQSLARQAAAALR